jgi:hypothetical protein
VLPAHFGPVPAGSVLVPADEPPGPAGRSAGSGATPTHPPGPPPEIPAAFFGEETRGGQATVPSPRTAPRETAPGGQDVLAGFPLYQEPVGLSEGDDPAADPPGELPAAVNPQAGGGPSADGDTVGEPSQPARRLRYMGELTRPLSYTGELLRRRSDRGERGRRQSYTGGLLRRLSSGGEPRRRSSYDGEPGRRLSLRSDVSPRPASGLGRRSTRPGSKVGREPVMVPSRQNSAAEPVTGLQPPDRIRLQGRLAAADAIVGLLADEAEPWRVIETRLAAGLDARWRPLAALLRPLFDSGALRPLLSTLSRGAEWEAPILAAGREIGRVALDAKAVGYSFTHDGRAPASVEFEAGTESQASEGTFREGRWRTTGALYIKGDAPHNQYRGTFGGYRDSLTQDQFDAAGRVVAKTKTVEPGVLFTGQVELGVTIELYEETASGRPSAEAPPVSGRHAVDIGVTVSVPRADVRDAAGNLPEVTEHYAPPARVTQFQRFGSTDTILDFHLMPGDPLAPDTALRPLRQTLVEWMKAVDAAGARVFGPDWATIAEQVAGQVQPGEVHQRLKAMGSGQPISVHGLPPGASVEVTARLVRLEHVRGTPQTEFATGTETSRRSVRQAATTKAGTLPAPGQDLGQPPRDVDVSGTGTGSAGRDRVQVRAESSRTGMQTKVKTQGELFDGVVELRFAMSYVPPLTAPFRDRMDEVATTRAGVRAVIERTECVTAASHDDTIWAAGETDPAPAPETDTELRAAMGDAAMVVPGPDGTPLAPYDNGLPLPPGEVWSRGLPDTGVILDLWGMERLRRELRLRLSDLAGAGNWAEIETTVLGGFDQHRLMANLSAMTRDTPLEGADLPHRLRGDFEITATAAVQALVFGRRVKNAELSPQGDVGSALSSQRFTWWTGQLQGQLGGYFGQAAAQQLLPTYGRQYRHRTGWRTGAGGQAIANAKFNAPLVYFTGLARLLFSASFAGRAIEFDVTLPFEVGLPSGLTGAVSPEGLQAWAHGKGRGKAREGARPGRPVPAITGDYGQLASEADWDIVPGSGYLVAKPERPEGFAVPQRVEDGRLSRSDFVLSIDDDSNQLVNRVMTVLRPLTGDAVRRRVRNQLDTAAVKAQVPGMTNGDVITVPVSGNGWSGHVVVSALVSGMTYRESTPKVEFENGADNYSSAGLSLEGRRRTILGLQYRGKFPHLSLSIAGTRNRDVSESLITEATGRAIARGKTVETGALLAGQIRFRVDYRLRRLGVQGFSPPADAREVAIGALVMVPERELRTVPEAEPGAGPAGAAAPQLPARWFALPERIRRRLGLSSSDIVLDVWPARQPDQRPLTMADMLRDPGLGKAGREVFGRSWPGMREKILAEVDLRRLQFDLKGMMAGHPITVDAPSGTTGRVLITARLNNAEHVSSTAQTEFNVGSGRLRDRSAADPHATSSQSTSKGLSVQVLGNTDPTGHLPSVQAGPTFVGVLGRNDYEFLASRVNSAMTTKVKAPGVAYEGSVGLQFRLESRSLLGDERVRLHQGASVNARFLAEQDEAVPAKSQQATRFAGEPLRSRELPVPPRAGAVAPPSRVWSRERGQGLRDSDTIRGLPDIGGLRQALDIEGRAVFGASAWRGLAPVVRAALAHPALMAGLPAMTRGEAVLNPLAFRELLNPDMEVTGEARVVRMQYRRTIQKAEMNPVNELTSASTRSEQFWWQAGLQVQAGPEIGPVTMAGVIGRLFRRRAATVSGSTGRVIANAKFSAPSAVYDAYVVTTFTLRSGTERRVITGVIPAEIGLPVSETTPAALGETEFRPPAQAQPGAQAATPARSLTTEERQAGLLLLGTGHGLGAEQAARAFDVVTRLRADRAGPPEASLAEYLRWLSRRVNGQSGGRAGGAVGARRLFRLLDLAGTVFDGGPVSVSVADLADLRSLSDVLARRPARGGPRSADVTAAVLREEHRRRGLPSETAVTAAEVRELARVALLEMLLGAGHRFTPDQLVGVSRLVARLRAHVGGPEYAPTADYLRWLGRRVNLPAEGRAGARRLVKLLDAARPEFADRSVTVRDLAARWQSGQAAVTRPPGRRLRRPVTAAVPAAVARPLGNRLRRRHPASGNQAAATVITHAETIRRQAEALLGAGHGFSAGQLSEVFKLVWRLRHETGPQDASTAEYLDWLGTTAGLHHQDAPLARLAHRVSGRVQPRRLFELLQVTAEVFGDEPVTVADLAAVRRLGDLVTIQPSKGWLRRRRPVTTERLREEFRRQLGLPTDAEVTAADLRDLVAMMRRAKAARRAAGGGRVRSRDLRKQVGTRREARWAAARVREHLNDGDSLTPEEQREMLGALAVGSAGGTYLPEVMDVLARAADEHLGVLFDDGGRLRALLDMAFIGSGPLRQRYEDFLRRNFRRELRWRDLVGATGQGLLTTPDGAPDEEAVGELAARIAAGFRRPYDGPRLPADMVVTLEVPATEAAALTVTSAVAGELRHSVLIRYEGLPDAVVKVCP